jgi:NADH dehydrogenase
MKVFLTGATGFVGKYMLERLLADGHAVRAALRGMPGQNARLVGHTQHIGRKDDFQWVHGDVVDGSRLEQGMQGCDAVIHLVGIIVEKGSNTFERVHHLGTRNVVEAAKRSGIRRFVQMSALWVRADSAAPYQTTKWKGEEEVRRSGIPFCILRPSLIFGEGDGFVTQMMETMRSAPLFRPVPGDGKPKFRPIFIDDVTACFLRALTYEAAINQTVELGGADELTLNDVLAEIARCAGVRKPAMHIPFRLCCRRSGGEAAESPVTTDNCACCARLHRDIGPMQQIFGVDQRGFTGCGRSARIK